MIKITQQDGWTEWALSQAPCNEIGTQMLLALERALDDFDIRQNRALIIHSDLSSGFCAGAHLKELHQEILSKKATSQEQELSAFLDRVHTLFNALDTLPMPTIGVINGICFGGGFELALTCDLLVAEPSARFCFPELRLGLIPGFGGIPRLRRELGNSVIRDLLLTGRSINAKTAKNLGLVSQLVAANEGLNVARRTAMQISKFDPTTVKTAKGFIKPLPKEALEEEKAIFLSLFKSPLVLAALDKFVNSQDLRPYLP